MSEKKMEFYSGQGQNKLGWLSEKDWRINGGKFMRTYLNY